jgi:hypothetical protein
LAFLRAFADDSASEVGDRRLFIAGYMNRTEDWALFADAWDEELKAEPAIDYLKMAEAQNLRDQFDTRKGWTEEKRAEKLRGLARVIRHFEPVSFQMSINREVFNRVLAPVTPRGLASPHFSCCAATVATIADMVGSYRPSDVQVEFIFDEQDGVSSDIDLFFEDIKPWLSRRAQKAIAGRPRFENDKHLTPLQAADMLAWHLRREHEDGRPNEMAKLLRNKDGHLVSEIDDAQIKRWADHDSKLVAAQSLKSKSQWRKFKTDVRNLKSRGIHPNDVGTNIFTRFSRRLRLFFHHYRLGK